MIEFQFSFTPSTTSEHTVWSPLIFGGFYNLVSNDDAGSIQFASCSLKSEVVIQQTLPQPVKGVDGDTVTGTGAGTGMATLFEDYGENALDGDVCAGGHKHQFSLLLFGGIEAQVSVLIYADAYANGDGAETDIDLSSPNGAIGCGGLFVS